MRLGRNYVKHIVREETVVIKEYGMKIVVATTFREFKGNDNDRIQYLFLENLKRQTFRDFILAVTTFGEKRVEGVVKEHLGNRAIVKEIAVPAEYRFSLTDVVLTGMDVAKQLQEDCVIVWCTCDVMLKSDFFQHIVDNYRPGLAGIVHPNMLYNTVEELECNRGTIESLGAGIDLLFFDAKVLEAARNEIKGYRFFGWGVFEWFLALVALRHATSRINLLGITSIGKIANNRKLTNESLRYFTKCATYNKGVIERYIRDTGVVTRYRDAVGLNCHLRYKLLVPISGYDDMIAKARQFNFCNWVWGKARSLYFRMCNLCK